MVKKRAAKKSRPKRKGGARRPTRRAKSNEVALTPVRTVVTKKIKELRRREQTPRVSEAIGRMEECLAQITQMCGDHMIFPV
jgi:hypothetical protein